MITPKIDAEQQGIAISTLNHNLEVLANLDVNDYLMVECQTDRIDVTRWWLRSSAYDDFVRAIDRTFHQTIEQEIGSKSLRQQYERAYDNLFKLMKSYEQTEAVPLIMTGMERFVILKRSRFLSHNRCFAVGPNPRLMRCVVSSP